MKTKITFDKLTIQNFKNHKDLIVEFGEETAISGGNGKGKTGIGETITWLFYGVDRSGSKFDPTPTTFEGNTKVELLLRVNEKPLLLGKENLKTTKYYINEVPEKAKAYEKLIDSLFDKNLFLSVYSPGYFFSQHWGDQRGQLLQYVSEPLNKEVLAELSLLDRDRLEENLKKKSLEDLEKIYRPQIKSKDTEYERAAERFLTLKEQLENEAAELKEVDKAVISSEMEKIKKEVAGKREANRIFQEKRLEISDFQHALKKLENDINNAKTSVINMINEPIKDTCETCGQNLSGEALEKVQHLHDTTLENAKKNGASLVKEFKSIQEKINQIEVPEEREIVDTSELEDRYYQLRNDLTAADRLEKLSENVKQAEANKEKVRTELGEARGIIEAIKNFNTKKSELMVSKVNGLLDQLTVKLFDKKKNGNVEPTFEVEMDGKPYSKLSTAEKIRAGLELSEVLIQQSECSIPVFVDNQESILSFKAPSAQLITAKVKEGELKIEVKGADQ